MVETKEGLRVIVGGDKGEFGGDQWREKRAWVTGGARLQTYKLTKMSMRERDREYIYV